MKKDNQYHNISKIVSYSNILFLIIFNVIGCDRIVDSQDGQDTNKNLVAFTTVLYDNSDDSYIEKLVIADFYDLDNYEISTDTVIFHWGPVFSGDKLKVLFGVPGLADGGSKIELYDLQSNQIEPLKVKIPDEFIRSLSLYGANVVWNQDGTGFYYDKTYTSQGVYFYSFSDSVSHTLRSGAFPIALIDSETLIVFGDIPEGDQLIDYNFYLMDTNGNYIDKINNSHLEYINRNGITTKAAQSLDYNTSSNLMVFSSRDSTVSGYKIAVTDLTGNYYKEYTQGDYLDDHPKWGPDGTILFDRRALNDHSNTGSKIMKINTETGEVTEFLSPNELQGAISWRYPEF